MAKANKQLQIDNQRLIISWLVGLAVVILLGGLWAWYTYLHRSAYNVFWDMMDNNLNVYGVTRRVEQGSDTSTIDQTWQLRLGAVNGVRGQTIVRQQGVNGETVIKTDVLATPDRNFVRYHDIQTTTKTDVSSVKDVWSKDILIANGQPNQSIFAEASLFSSIPFADLNQQQRLEVLQIMKDTNAYEVDYKGAKVVENAGKQAYQYNVTVNLEGYIAAIKKIDAMMNLNQLQSIDPASYAGAEPAQLQVVASITGRQLLEVSYEGASRKETFSGYGAKVLIDIPKTDVLRSDLEQKVQKLFAPAGGA